jgi:hypothetical protein
MMRLSWSTWFGATALTILYAGAGYMASSPDTISLTLEPGYSTQVRLFRFAEDQLRMRLIFQDDRLRRRPELGSSSTRSDSDWRTTGLLKFDDPGSAIRIVASMPDAAPVNYEALPNSARWEFKVKRDLTPGRSVSPGVWQWPPTSKGLKLQPGTNIVKIEVLAVERPLVGEYVELSVNPALGFYNLMPNVGWLWPSLLWPFFAIILAVWAIALRRQNRAHTP